MAAFTRARPTTAELEILQVLWERGPSTVREVHEVLSARKPTGYTTVLKMLQIMSAKGAVIRDESARAHIYKARRPAENTKRQLVTDLVQRAFAGSASDLMMHALAGRKTPRRELEEIRRMLDEYEGKTK